MAGQMRNPLDSTKNWPAVIKAVRDPLGLMALALLAVCVIVVVVLLTGALGEHDPRILIGFIIGAILSLAGFGAVMWGDPGKFSPGGQPGDDSIPDPPGGPKDPPAPGIVAPENGTGSSVSPTIHSPFPVIEVESRTTSDGEAEIIVTRMSDRAKQFFGYTPNKPTDELVGRNAEELRQELAAFIAPPRPAWTDLEHDQKRVAMLVAERGGADANVPVRFNKNHPDEGFKNKTFVPIITEVRKERGKEGGVRNLRVLYLDTAKLPKTLFTKTVWNNVVKENKGSKDEKLYFDELASDFERIYATFINEKFEDEDGGEERKSALASAIKKLRKGDPETLEDLSRAGWHRLREVATRIEPSPNEARVFIESIVPRPPSTPAAPR